jgi:hypothetical protein
MAVGRSERSNGGTVEWVWPRPDRMTQGRRGRLPTGSKLTPEQGMSLLREMLWTALELRSWLMPNAEPWPIPEAVQAELGRYVPPEERGATITGVCIQTQEYATYPAAPLTYPRMGARRYVLGPTKHSKQPPPPPGPPPVTLPPTAGHTGPLVGPGGGSQGSVTPVTDSTPGSQGGLPAGSPPPLDAATPSPSEAGPPLICQVCMRQGTGYMRG